MTNMVYIYVNGVLALTIDKVELWRTMQTQDDSGNIELHFKTEGAL